MIAGVLAHLMLHWNWITGMTKKMLFSKKRPESTSLVAAVVTMRHAITRRQFLSLGLAALFTGVIAASYSVFIREQVTDTGQDDELPPSSQQESDARVTDEKSSSQQGSVACPRGLVNNPYPGRCRHYIDQDGDGFCDYSVPGSGNN
jgi:hypothetical protein